MAKSDKSSETNNTQPQAAASKGKPAVKVTDPAVVVRKITGRGMVGCRKTADRLTDKEKSDLVAAYNGQKQPRSVLQKALDRIADEKIKADAAKKDPSGE